MNMRKKTDRALNGAIVHWEANLAAAVADITFETGPDDCPLCEMFFAEGCYGCPVMEHTSRDACEGTPYKDVASAIFRRASREVLVTEVQRELNFLRSLQEKRKTERKKWKVSKEYQENKKWLKNKGLL